MSSRCLTLAGTASIQDYLFRTNRLKENLGGSYLAAAAIRDFASRTGGQLVFEGGGNVAAIFADLHKAKSAVHNWSRHWMDEAPGLRLVVAHREFSEGQLAVAYSGAQKLLFANENRPAFGSHLGALPVVRGCASTGLAADVFYDETWLNEESARKQQVADSANHRFQERYRGCLNVGGKTLRFALDFEDLGQHEGASHIAVVHVDGNGVGQVFQKIASEPSTTDEAFREKMKAASNAIRRITRDALALTFTHLSSVLKDLDKQGIYLKDGYYPVRPLVDEGDELTAVCQGKAGLMFTAVYLAQAEKIAAEQKNIDALLGHKLTFCAGVAIVGQRFPFARAYRLAEELTASAKRRRKRAAEGIFPSIEQDDSRDVTLDEGSWMDFEIVREATDASLDEIRTQYERSEVDSQGLENRTQLLRRPYRLDGDALWSWKACEQRWREFHGSRWARSASKRFLETLARGEEDTKLLIEALGSRNRRLPEPSCGKPVWFHEPKLDESKVKVKNTLYFDPLDFLDFHIDLAQESDPKEEAPGHVATSN